MEAVRYVMEVSTPMVPLPTGWSPLLRKVTGVKVFLFDIYGTLVQSAAGDISLVSTTAYREGMEKARRLLGDQDGDTQQWLDAYRKGIEDSQEAARSRGIEFPEVEIRDVWKTLAEELMDRQPGEAELEKAALCFESAVNPVWEMPGAAAMVSALGRRGIPMGLISNAQFYTQAVLDAALGPGSEGGGFDPGLTLFSYRERIGKPSPRLYEMMKEKLHGRGIATHEVIYFGNDLRKDILPAREAGFRAGLFAGDGRSLRVGDYREAEVGELCDVILTEWSQWEEIV